MDPPDLAHHFQLDSVEPTLTLFLPPFSLTPTPGERERERDSEEDFSATDREEEVVELGYTTMSEKITEREREEREMR